LPTPPTRPSLPCPTICTPASAAPLARACVCMRVHFRARVPVRVPMPMRVGVRAYVRACARACVCARVCVSLFHPALSCCLSTTTPPRVPAASPARRA
jgi:hypothetical protein